MTSLRKVTDYTKVKPRPPRFTEKRKVAVSVHAEAIDMIMELGPPEGVLIEVPESYPNADRYRRALREAVTRLVEPVSPHRYRVSVADTGEILVGCYD